jgi:hypothetical protein
MSTPYNRHPQTEVLLAAHGSKFYYDTFSQCDSCARNRIAEKKHTNVMNLFPANGPMESVAMYILGKLPRTKHVNRFLLIIADRFTKVTITVQFRILTALVVAKAFCDRWYMSMSPYLSTHR